MERWPSARKWWASPSRPLIFSLNYAKTRVQFGQPIGSFQAIKHKLANMVLDVDGSRYVTYHAAWLLKERGCRRARDRRGESLDQRGLSPRRREGQQVHGGIGYTKEYLTCSSIRAEPKRLKSPSMTLTPTARRWPPR